MALEMVSYRYFMALLLLKKFKSLVTNSFLHLRRHVVVVILLYIHHTIDEVGSSYVATKGSTKRVRPSNRSGIGSC